MNKLFLSLAFLFSALVLNAQTRIDFDYTKSFEVSSLWIDYNQNDEPELDEFFKVSKDMSCTINIDYRDFDDAGIHYTDNEKANSEFAEYLRNTYEERHKKTVVFLDYQNRLHDGVKKAVKRELLNDFNKIYTKEKSKGFTTIVRSGKGGFTSEDLINYIDAEIQCLPQHCLRECFDENANIKQYKERHYDTTLKIKNSLNTDEKGNSVFVFEWQRNSDGNIILFRMRIGDKNKWYNIFIDEPRNSENTIV